ncbi:MAG: hypothetical protein CHACPFDD_03833 [Phycisphaerae bacterium]|nr:hypothetical protein [Phycisphaerae bacterium]
MVPTVTPSATAAHHRPACVARLRSMAIDALRRMYLPQEQMFCFCIRRTDAGDRPEGVSRRYTAITLLGLAGEDEAVARRIVGPGGTAMVLDRLLEDVDDLTNLGDVALTLWAAARLNHDNPAAALERLIELDPATQPYPTVELAWALTALSLHAPHSEAAEQRDAVARRLLSAFNDHSGLFPHYVGGRVGALRAHVACFADLVYPIQALSHYHQVTPCDEALAAARRCAAAIRDTQGPDGQYWWHHDVRTGNVIEGYPVYAVHQNSMAPMALHALRDAGGDEHADMVEAGLAWLERSPELGGASLIDESAGLIWRKVARREPRKLARRVQAVASAIHPALRVPGVDVLMPPHAIDYESRPYHMGWILLAWPPQRAERT